MRFAGEGGGMKKNEFKRGLTGRLLVYVKPYRGYVVGAAICSLLYVAFVLLGPVLYGWAIDAMVGAGQVDFQEVYLMSGGFALCVLLAFASQKLLNNFVNALCYKLVRDLRKDAFYSLSAAPVKYADTHAQGDVMARVVNDVDIISDGLLQGVAQLFTGVTTILGTLVVMFVINYIIALVVVLLTPLSLFRSRCRAGSPPTPRRCYRGKRRSCCSGSRNNPWRNSSKSTRSCTKSAGARNSLPLSLTPARGSSTPSSMRSSAYSARCSA